MGKRLVIAEKPSVAADLARALGKFERNGDYFENETTIISSAIGHLVEICAPEGVEVKRGKWNLENLPVLPHEFALRPIEKTETRFNLLKRLIKKKEVSELVNACDAGREGELIFRNLARISGTTKPIKRLWLQSMTPQSIRDAYANLRSDEEMRPLADAATSRSESDWLVGINSTRALTAFNSRIGGFQKTTAGRVQTPTLAILVEREEKIRAFQPRPYFEVFGDFGVTAGSYRGRWFDEKFKKAGEEDARAERIWDLAKAETIKAKCDGKPGVVTEEKKPTSQAAPQLYDLTTLQREANSRFSFSARRTLQIAQALYERHKVLTYPRTDSRYLPEDHLETAKGVLASIADQKLAPLGEKALKNGWVRPNKRVFNNAKVSDHFAIVPTGTDPKSLDEAEQKLFDMVMRRFIAVFYPPAEFEVTTRITIVEEEKFKTDGKIIVKPGWMEVYGRQAEAESESDKTIVPIETNERVQTLLIEIKENVTKPAPRYTEATLLSAMEGAGKFVEDEELREAMSEKGLGTPATRASIIEGLIYEGYIDRQGRDLIAMAKGISLITLLRNLHAEVLCKPELTGEWESKLKQMERGKLGRAEFMEQIRGLTQDLVAKVKTFTGTEIQGDYQPLEVTCPKCGSSPFNEDYRTFECANCGLRVWKKLADREFEREEVKTLLGTGRVGPLSGFRSKMGRTFDAAVTIGEVENEEKGAKEWRVTFEFDKPAGSEGAAADLEAAPVIGEANGGVVKETAAAFIFVPADAKAKPVRMGKTILQKEIPVAQALKLFREGKTDLLPKFISKKGRPFSAYLKLEGDKVGFEFEPRAKKEKAPAKKTAKAAEPAA
jgi:DNA topoisomerase-3